MREFKIVNEFKEKEINLPKRETKHAAGYDFECAEEVVVHSIFKLFTKNIHSFLFDTKKEEYQSMKPTIVKTGIKADMMEDEYLMICSRSSNPLKFGLLLSNSLGIIDKDFFENERDDGHIRFAFWNLFPFDFTIKKGQRIGQGIFQKFLLTNNDNATGERNGGLGSTGE